jgi:LmbE family N-acetylglucosaminyl deacetylase
LNKKVLVIAAHPDDEILGCGGTVARHAKNGDKVQFLIVCEGESLRYGKDVGQQQATQLAADILGVNKVHRLDFPDQLLRSRFSKNFHIYLHICVYIKLVNLYPLGSNNETYTYTYLI